jgi:hypothetical protein
MMPYVQGDPTSVPDEFDAYRGILASLAIEPGEVGYLTIDESPVTPGTPHRAAHAKHERALHTEAGKIPGHYVWGGGGHWGGRPRVSLARDTRILLANSIDSTCAVWDAEHEDTSSDGDIGHVAELYPYEHATLLRAGEVREIGILTPHESLPVFGHAFRQFLRIVGRGVRGREDYFTLNPLMRIA